MGVGGSGIVDSGVPRRVGLQRQSGIPVPDQDLLSWLARSAEDVVGSLIDPGAGVALLDFPMYANVGDSAIWIGTRRLLRRLGVRVVYMADVDNYSPTRLVRRLPRGTVLLQGGGNFGDLWPLCQRFRESVIATLPGHRIIQLPQTLRFRRSETLVHAKSVLNRHPNFILLVRDPRSLEFARREFTARSILCPDLALAIGALERRGRPAVDIVALRRGDLEASGGFPDLSGAVSEHVDWTADPTGYAGRVWGAIQRFRGRAGTVGLVTNLLLHPYDLLALQRLARGCRILSRGRAVLTDRLHGHIMSLLLGIPHVLLDDRYGKLRSFYETWTKGSALVSWADSPDEGRTLALATVRGRVG
jgi:pyruvyl transferase EpsO